MGTRSILDSPLNIDLIQVKAGDLPRLGQVKELQIFDNTGNLHPSGLFSTTIFGAVGSEYRNRTFGYIDLKVDILHPFLYYTIIKLKGYYKDIMDSRVYAVWDDKTKQFIKSNAEEAKTGYHFFFSKVKELKFEKNGSDRRDAMVDLYEKAVKDDKLTMRYHLVMPAGIRDYTVDANGSPQEDEINTYYRSILAQTNLIDPLLVVKNPDLYDSPRMSIQKNSLVVFEYIKSLLEGKSKLILGKWLTRKIFNSTRNVLSNGIEKGDHADDANRLGLNDCYCGIHQYARCIVPKSHFEIKNKYISSIFPEGSNTAYVVDPKTLKRVEIMSTSIQKDIDMWTTTDGLEKVIASLGNEDMRHLPVTCNKGKNYLALIYRDDKHFKVFGDIGELPDGFDKSKVQPISLAELIYGSIYHLNGKIAGTATRYPITGFGSIIPVKIKIITTNTYDTLEELDDNWQPSGNIASSFPIRGLEFFNSMSVSRARYAGLTADVDGDTLSLVAVLTDEASIEIEKYLTDKSYYIGTGGVLNVSVATDTLDAVLNYIT